MTARCRSTVFSNNVIAGLELKMMPTKKKIEIFLDNCAIKII